jgi:DNA-binding protein H-NS
MPRETYAAQQAHIEKEIDKLRKKAQALLTKRRKPVVTSIIRSMREYEITPEEITAAFGKAPARRNTSASKNPGDGEHVKRPVAAKYRDPETGLTWTGRGKTPLWLTAAESQGISLDTFLIKS